MPLPSSVPTPQKSAFARVIGVFFEPDATFADIARSPGFLLPLILVMLSSAAVAIVSINRLDLEQVARQQIMKQPQAADLPKDQLEQRVQMGAKISKYVYYCIPLIVPIMLAIVAGLLFVMSNFIMGGTATYKQMFAVEVHAQMPGIIMGILAVIVLFLKDPGDIDVQNIVTANLGPFVTTEASPFGHRIASAIDLFSFWQMFLLGVGISKAARISFVKALMGVVIPWALFVLITGFFAR